MATTKITNPDLFDLGSLNTALQLPNGTTAERPTSPSTGEWRYNTTTNLVEFWDGGEWRDLQSEEIPPVPSENFNTVLYNGTSATHAITGVGFQPDLVWIKDRNNGESHIWNDSTRGAGNDLSSNSINAQANRPTGFTSFDSDGFTLGTDGGGVVNDSTRGPYVAWCWKANGGTTSSNTDGTITSTVQANTKAGFSIINYTGNLTAGATVGHGLGSTPELIIFKPLVGAAGWKVYSNQLSDPANKVLSLQDSHAELTINAFNGTLPNSSVITLAAYGDTNRTSSIIAYAFKSVAGYSKTGSYTGNGSDNGPIINTGFEPAFVIIKRTDTADNWSMTDNKRSTSNPRDKALFPNLTQSELTSGYSVNYLSNGFQIATSGAGVNASGGTFLYIAFASDPSAAPVLADSFNTSLYTGNGTSQSITGLGFSPNLVWLKSRSATWGNFLQDSIRGAENFLISESSAAQGTTVPAIVDSFDTDGFTVLANGNSNELNTTYVSWNWKANPIPTINTDGTIQSVVSANQAAGFSIVKYTGDGNTSSTVGHGLPSAPKLLINKSLGNAQGWAIVHEDLSTGYYIGFSTSGESNSLGNDGSITKGDVNATNFGFTSGASGVNGPNLNGNDYITYCFTSIAGFSKVGSYTGNGSATGPIVTTGFQPDFVIIKSSSLAGTAWVIFDSARSPSNPRQLLLQPQSAAIEQNVGNAIDFNADNFQLTDTNDSRNGSGQTYIYMAFKENPTYPRSLLFLVVAGGGGGGTALGDFAGGIGGGGAGAGGLRTSFGSTSGGGSSSEPNYRLGAGTYTITVGAGGTGNTQGGDSSISHPLFPILTSVGGGDGGDRFGSAGNGGSGGGQATDASGTPGQGTVSQGFNGGPTGGSGTGRSSAGGGGASAAGGGISSTTGGAGGAGLAVSITGSSVTYAGGGGGAGGGTSSQTGGAGGSGIGGNGGNVNAGNGGNGTANTGSGGGGAGGGTSTGGTGTGGSGIVILRLPTADYSGTTTGSPTVTTDGSDTILTYTGSGTYVHS